MEHQKMNDIIGTTITFFALAGLALFTSQMANTMGQEQDEIDNS